MAFTPFRITLSILLAGVLLPLCADAQIPSVQPGNWSSPQTWLNGIVPGAGAAALVRHAVVVDAPTIVGTSPASGETPAITVVSGASLSIAAGIHLTVRGDVALANGPLVLNGSSIFEFDASQAASPAATRYLLKIGTAPGQTSSRLVLNGTASARCLLTSASTNGAAPGAITDSSLPGGGLVTGSYCDLRRIGDAQYNALSIAATGASFFSLSNVTFDSCGLLATTFSVGSDAAFVLRNTTFRNSQASAAVMLNFYNAKSLSGTRILDGNVFDKTVLLYPPRAVEISNNIFYSRFQVSSDDVGEGWASFRGNFVRNPSPLEVILAGDSTDNYWLTDVPRAQDYNPHFVQALTWRGMTIDGDIFEYTGTDDNGDCISLANPPAAAALTIRRCIALPNGGVSTSGTLFSALGGPNASVSAEHNTWFTGPEGAAVGETYPGYPGMVRSFKSNLGWDDTPRGWLLYDSGINDPVPDLVSAANADFNCGYNVRANYAGLEFTSGAPGEHDVNVNPEFVDPRRNLAAWDLSLGGPGTVTHAVEQLLLKNDAGVTAGYTTQALAAYIRGGFAPTNVTLAAAAHDGGTIGAVRYVGAATPTPIPTATPTPTPTSVPTATVTPKPTRTPKPKKH